MRVVTKNLIVLCVFPSLSAFSGGLQSKPADYETVITSAHTIVAAAGEFAPVAQSVQTVSLSDPRVAFVSKAAHCSLGLAHICLQNRESLKYLEEFIKTTKIEDMDCKKAEEMLSNISVESMYQVLNSFGLDGSMDEDLIKIASRTTVTGAYQIKSLLDALVIFKDFYEVSQKEKYKNIKDEMNLV